MFLNKDSIQVSIDRGLTWINLGEYLLQADYGYNKLWGSDTGRNLAFTQVGTLGGIFPKIVMTFRKMNSEEIHKIAPILDSASQLVKYDDDNKGKQLTMETYTGDWKIVCKRMKIGESFTCSFISRKRRK